MLTTEDTKIIIFILLLARFSHQRSLMVFHWISSDSTSSQVSRTLLSILANLNTAVVWMVSSRPPILNSSCPLPKPLEIILSASIFTGITVTFIFHSFLLIWQDPSICLSFCCSYIIACNFFVFHRND